MRALSCPMPGRVVSPRPAPCPIHPPSLYPPSPSARTNCAVMPVGAVASCSLASFPVVSAVLSFASRCAWRMLVTVIFLRRQVSHNLFRPCLHHSMPCTCIPAAVVQSLLTLNNSRVSSLSRFSLCRLPRALFAPIASCTDTARLGNGCHPCA